MRIARETGLIDEACALLAKIRPCRDALTATETLPYGKQRLLEVALALALKPQVLLLDEPAAGLSTQQGHELFAQLAALMAGTTILFIEHDMNLVFRYADTVSVFAAGALVVQDTPERCAPPARAGGLSWRLTVRPPRPLWRSRTCRPATVLRACCTTSTSRSNAARCWW